MKSIKKFIQEGWEYLDNINSTSSTEIDIPNQAKWLLINTETETISAITEKDLKSFTEDYGDDGYVENGCKKLKIGDSFDSDGGINIYIRIKK